MNNEVRLFFSSAFSSFRVEDVEKFKPDLVCISCVTANFGWALQTAKTMKTHIKVADIVIGGVHPTLCPESVESEGFKVCVGDGIKYFGGKFDPDTLWADREIFFEQLPPVHRAYQIFMTGFGCPFRCSYCNNHQLHRKLVRRSPEGCIRELEHLKRKGLRYVLFDDDIFTIDKRWLKGFLGDYHTHINLPFTCFGHALYVDDDVAQSLKRSGCQCVWLGVQTGDETLRKNILNRPETNLQIKTACDIIRKNKMKLMIDHIFGIPGDTYQTLLNSYQFYKTLKPDVVNCYELLYFPKAEINKYGHSQALYQKQGGLDFKRYARSFTSIPLLAN